MNVPIGTHIIQPNPDQVKIEIESGKQFIVYSTDAMMLQKQSNIFPLF
jgi:2-dehydro-3-deoxyglucarate aldolase